MDIILKPFLRDPGHVSLYVAVLGRNRTLFHGVFRLGVNLEVTTVLMRVSGNEQLNGIIADTCY